MSSDRPLRIAYGRVFHEANAFSPLSTEREDFERMHCVAGEELARRVRVRGSEIQGFMPHAELTGFVQAARVAGGVETVPLSSMLAIPSGPVSASCFEWILETLLTRLRDAGPVDGVYLALHGSMEVQGLDEAPEVVIVRRVREIVGENAGIAVSFDLHANLSAGLVDPVDVVIAYRTNPHWDLAPTGWRAGSRLIKALRGEHKPTHAWRKLPLVLGGGTTIHFMKPMRAVFRWMKRLERDPRVISASLFMVHPYTSADDLGWAAHVATNDDPALANQLAEELADRAWAQRKVALPPTRSVDEALDEVRVSPWRHSGPLTLVDMDDIVGAGAPGGNTRVLDALVRDDRGLRTYVPVHDPAAVHAAWDLEDGTETTVTLRGTPGYDQPEVTLTGRVAAHHTGDFGRVVRLDAGTFHVAICERPPLPIHPRFWRELDLEPRQADAIVQKNFFHYRIFYAHMSFRHLPMVSEGATSFDRLRERQWPVPSYPSGDPEDWRAGDPLLRSMTRRRVD